MGQLPSPVALRMFVEAAKQSSFVRAAEVLNVTQAAVSKQIATLELRIGSDLFERRHRSVSLTVSGEAYLSYAEKVLQLLETGAAASAEHSGREGLVVVVDHEFLDFVVGPRLHRLQSALPEVDISFIPEVGRRVASNCDLAITFGHPSDRGLQSERLCTFQAFAVGTPSLIQNSSEPLRELPLLHDVDTYWWNAILNAEGVSRKLRGFVMGSGAAAIRAATNGAGLAVGDSILCGDALSSGSLVRIGDTALPGRIDYWLSMRKPANETRAAAKFKAWIRDELEGLLPEQ